MEYPDFEQFKDKIENLIYKDLSRLTSDNNYTIDVFENSQVTVRIHLGHFCS